LFHSKIADILSYFLLENTQPGHFSNMGRQN
jgi:hypothetical protein